MTKRRLATAALSILLGWAATACGNLTPGGLTGDATVIVSGDADTLSAAAALAAPHSPTWRVPASVDESEVEGEIEVSFRTYLMDDGGGELQLGTGTSEVKVDLRGRTEADVIDRQVIPALRYTELRLVFTKIHAEVEGLVIDSVQVKEVHVELEGISLVVSRAIELDVQDGGSAELVVDLNSLAWLDAVDPVTGGVDESVFQDLVNVVVR